MRGEPMKPATNRLAGWSVQLHRRADLLDAAGLQHHDLAGHGHRLDLVVGHVDHGGRQLLVQAQQLDAHLAAQGRVQVGQRLVEQEHPRLPHDGAPDRHPLPLAPGQRARPAGPAAAPAAGCAPPRRPWPRARPGDGRPASARSPCCRRPSCAGRARSSGTPWPARARPDRRRSTRAPSISRSPAVMSSSPAIMRSRVDLPQPDGPTNTTNSRSATSRSMPLMVSVPAR